MPDGQAAQLADRPPSLKAGNSNAAPVRFFTACERTCQTTIGKAPQMKARACYSLKTVPIYL